MLNIIFNNTEGEQYKKNYYIYIFFFKRPGMLYYCCAICLVLKQLNPLCTTWQKSYLWDQTGICIKDQVQTKSIQKSCYHMFMLLPNLFVKEANPRSAWLPYSWLHGKLIQGLLLQTHPVVSAVIPSLRVCIEGQKWVKHH